MRGHQERNDHYDVVVVGARCAGASLAARLARGGRRVAVVDADRLPSDTVSTHVMFPDSLRQLSDLGVLNRLRSGHRLTPVCFSWRVLGQAVSGGFTPVDGHDRCLSVRRITLDAALQQVAEEAGAVLLPARRVVGMLGAGTPADPAQGVILDDGRRLIARWVVGADGRRSTVARQLGVTTTEERRGEMAFLLAYWRELPASDWCVIDVHERSGLMSVPVEDGLHLLSVSGRPDLTRGTRQELEARYHEMLESFPAVLNPRVLARGHRESPVIGAPETMMRGHVRPASGAGWALVGDAGRLTHPATAQGIGDALAQSEYVAADLLNGGDLSGFGPWRDARAAGHAEWSFRAARFPRPEDAGLYAGIAADADARQGFLDTFTKRTRLDDVVTPARSARWRAASAYQDGLLRLDELVADVPPARSARIVPACPAWTVRQLVAHLAGVLEDSRRGGFFAGALDAWRDDALAAEREAWTDRHVADRAGRDLERLAGDMRLHGAALVRALRSGQGPAVRVPSWMLTAPVADLAVHLDDLAEALDVEPQPEGLVARAGFGLYRRWLAIRLDAQGLPGIQLSDGQDQWVAGSREPAATVTADRHELFRVIAGRRSAARIRELAWTGNPETYLPVISPYPLPA